MIAFDTNILSKFLKPDIENKIYDEGRLDILISGFVKDNIKIAIPTPVLAEVLVNLNNEAAISLYSKISMSTHFRILPFDIRSAIELSIIIRKAILNGDLREGLDGSVKREAIKFDRQIIAICLVNDIDTVYSDDSGLVHFAKLNGLKTKSLEDIEFNHQPNLL